MALRHQIHVLSGKAPEIVVDTSGLAGCASVLVQLFAVTEDRDWVRSVLHSLSLQLPEAAVIGASANEGIASGSIVRADSIVASIVGFETTLVRSACELSVTDSGRAGKRLAKKLCSEKTRAIIAFADAESTNGEAFLEGMARMAPNLVIAGGIASSADFRNTYTIFGQEIIESGVVGASLSGEVLKVHRAFNCGWKPVGREMVVTEASGARLAQIDGSPARSVLVRYLGRKVVDRFPELGSAFPLLIKRDGPLIARGIIALEGDVVVVSGNLHTGDRIFIGYGNPMDILKNNRIVDEVLDSFGEPEAAFAYSCVGRKYYLPGEVTEFEVAELGRLPGISGAFTLGEFYTGSAPTHLNFSSTLLALREGDCVRTQKRRKRATRTPHLESPIAIADGLFHLIDVRTAELDHLAYHDSLTGLPNTLLFRDRLEHACLHGARQGGRHALFFLDLDGFKIVNDTLGHRAGDLLLQIVAGRLQAALRVDDTVARIAGDEFAILIENAESDVRIAHVAEKLIGCVAMPTILEQQEMTVTVSLGIALYPADGTNADTLLRNADAAMYRAKARGRNGFSFYRKELTEEATAKFNQQNEVRLAVERGDLLLHFQPQFDLATGRLTGAEALVRWKHAQRGIIMPNEFVPVAEECGLIDRISTWVLGAACTQLAAWHGDGFLLPRLSVNFSAAEFARGTFVQRIATALRRNSILPEFLEIEITEGVLLPGNTEDIQALRRMGLRLAIDDFGTGYSSFAYLGKLTIDRLKIDRSFLRGVPGDQGNEAITRAILLLAREFGIPVVAEGVETRAQHEFLLAEGCSGGQGYLYGKPAPADAFREQFGGLL